MSDQHKTGTHDETTAQNHKLLVNGQEQIKAQQKALEQNQIELKEGQTQIQRTLKEMCGMVEEIQRSMQRQQQGQSSDSM